MQSIPIEITWISICGTIAILLITIIIFIWQWQDRRKKKPFIIELSYQEGNNYFNVSIHNNASYNLIVYKAYKGKFWFFRKQMSVGTLNLNNKAHSDNLAEQKLGDVDLSSGGKRKEFKMYVKLNEDVSEKNFYFKTNSGTCKKKSKKITT